MADVWPPAGDKCEANYAVVPFVAEFWSTLTAVAFVSCVLLGQSLLQRVPLGYAIPKILWELSDGT